MHEGRGRHRGRGHGGSWSGHRERAPEWIVVDKGMGDKAYLLSRPWSLQGIVWRRIASAGYASLSLWANERMEDGDIEKMSGDDNESAAGRKQEECRLSVSPMMRPLIEMNSSRFVYFGGWDGATRTGRVPARMSGWPSDRPWEE